MAARPMRHLLLFPLCALLAGCTTFEPDQSRAGRLLAQKRAAWHELELNDYRVSITISCFCPPSLLVPVRLEIVGGSVVAAFDEETGELLPEPTAAGYYAYYTVLELFAVIEDAIQSRARLEVEYDPVLHYPRFINTWMPDVMDSGLVHTARDLVPLE